MSPKTKKKTETLPKGAKRRPSRGGVEKRAGFAFPCMMVGDLAAGLAPAFEVLVGGRGLDRELRDDRLPRLSGSAKEQSSSIRGRVLFVWWKELQGMRESSLRAICALGAAAIVVPEEADLPPAMRQAARRSGTAILSCRKTLKSGQAAVRSWIRSCLALETTVQGVFVEVSGVGLLILGPSGIGKSESALDLVMRGHRLIADDLILVRRDSEGRLTGRGMAKAGAHMEIRGLGIINIRDLFGVSSVLEKKAVEMVVDLRSWTTRKDWDRLGLEDRFYELLGVQLPYLQIPVYHGRNMAVILEVAVRNQMLKREGRHTARIFAKELRERLIRGGRKSARNRGARG